MLKRKTARKQNSEILNLAAAGSPVNAEGGHGAENLLMKTYLHLFLISAVGLVAYSNTFHVPFILDDIPQIAGNSMIRSIHNFGLALAGYHFSDKAGYVYVPSRFVGYLSFGLNYHFGGLDVVGYHLINILIHITNALSVYFLVVLTFMTPKMQPASCGKQVDGTLLSHPRLVALAAALLFVSHPVQTQAVTYLIQRFASLAAMFYLLSIIMYIKGRLIIENAGGDGPGATGRRLAENKSLSPDAYRPAPIAYFLFALFFAVLAMKTKEIAFTLPIVIALYEFLFFPAPLKKRLVWLIPILATIFIIPLSLIKMGGPVSGLFSDLMGRARLGTDVSRIDYLMTEMRVIMTYIRLLLFPVRQNIDYDYTVYHSFFKPAVFFSSVFLLFVFGTGLYCLYRARILFRESSDMNAQAVYRFAGFGILWFFITLSVESSVIPITDVIFEHRVYLPSVGAFCAIAACCGQAGRLKVFREGGNKLAIAAFSLIVLALSAATLERNSLWRDPVALWKDAVKKSPLKARPRYNLAEAYLAQGRIADYLHEYEAVVNARPGDAEAHYNLGSAYSKQKRFGKAERELIEAIRIRPDYGHAHNNLGVVYSNTGRRDEAIREFLTAIRLHPDYAEAHNNLGGEYFKQGRLDEAMREYRTAVGIDPYYCDAYYNLGAVYEKKGNDGDAVREFKAGENINPDDAETHFQLGTLYAKQRRFAEAADEFQSAFRVRPDDIDAGNNLAYAYYMTGRIDDAIAEFRHVLGIKPGDGDALRGLERLRKARAGKMTMK